MWDQEVPKCSTGQQAAPCTPRAERPQGRTVPVVGTQGPVGTGSSGYSAAKGRGVLRQEVHSGKVKGSVALLLTIRNVGSNSLLQ